jgi:hypothetical protein
MSTTTATQRSGLGRWAALGGVAYVVLFIAGIVIKDIDAPEFDAAPGVVISFYGDSDNRDQVALGWGLVLLGVFCFLWFLGAVREFMRRIDADPLLTNVATIGGAVYASLTLTGIGLEAGVETMSDDTFRDQVFPELIHAARDAGYVLHATGGVGAAALIVAFSLAALRAGLVPRWAGWIGVAIGILALGSIFFFPMALIALWLVTVSFLLFRAASRPGPPTEAARL